MHNKFSFHKTKLPADTPKKCEISTNNFFMGQDVSADGINKEVLTIKGKIILAFMFFILMALLPVGICSCGAKSREADENAVKTQKNISSSETPLENYDRDEILCAMLAAQYKKSYDDKSLEGIAILLNTNYTVQQEKIDLSDKSTAIFEKDANAKLKEDYGRIKTAVKKCENRVLKKGDKVRYIPFDISSNGQTQKSEKYDYIRSVASPWDCFSKNRNEHSCVGVSLYGLDYLCKNGFDAQNALLWYLPGFEVTEAY